MAAQHQQKRPPIPIWLDFCVSGAGVGIATACTNPIDVIKTRMQLSNRAQGARPVGMVRTAGDLLRHEGVLALGNGMTMAVTRAVVYGGLRLGLHPAIKGIFDTPGLKSGSENSAALNVAKNAGCGIVSGAAAASLANPLDLVKVRLQQKGHSYRGAFHVFSVVWTEEGIKGLFRGTVPSAVRAGLLTASQVASYDQAKTLTLKFTSWGDGLQTHLAASAFAGLVTTTTTTPADVIKTRVFVGGAQGLSPWQCVKDLVAREGLLGLMKGWTANYARFGPQTALTFVSIEAIRKLIGLQGL